jgi:hypothetical protein
MASPGLSTSPKGIPSGPIGNLALKVAWKLVNHFSSAPSSTSPPIPVSSSPSEATTPTRFVASRLTAAMNLEDNFMMALLLYWLVLSEGYSGSAHGFREKSDLVMNDVKNHCLDTGMAAFCQVSPLN